MLKYKRKTDLKKLREQTETDELYSFCVDLLTDFDNEEEGYDVLRVILARLKQMIDFNEEWFRYSKYGLHNRINLVKDLSQFKCWKKAYKWSIMKKCYIFCNDLMNTSSSISKTYEITPGRFIKRPMNMLEVFVLTSYKNYHEPSTHEDDYIKLKRIR